MSHFSRIAFFIAAFAVLLTVLFFPRWEHSGTEAPIAWDVSGYYLYLPAIFIYDDLEKLEFFPEIIEKYQPSHAFDQAFPVENGNLVTKYPAGMAVLYLPFFLLAHAIASTSDFPADGFSLPYQIAIQLGGALVAILGLFYLRKILRHFFTDRAVGYTILLIAIGTNFFNYATFDAGNVHVWSFTLLALLTHLTIQWHQGPNWRGALGIGACIGLAALVRPTEVIFAIVPLLWGVVDLESLQRKFQLCKKHFPKLLAAAAVTGAIGFIQLAYWKSVAGEWIVYSYQDQGFSILSPHFPNALFSYRKGWFIYTPLMLFTVGGFIFWIKKWRQKESPYLLPVLLFFLINTWIVCSWDIWWYGGAFGQRAMIASYVLLAFPLAALLEWVGKRRWTTWLIATLMSGCTLLNLFQTYQAHWSPWEPLDMNGAYYWRIFASVKDYPSDKPILDTNEAFSGKKRNEKLVYKADLQSSQDSIGVSHKVTYKSNFSLAVEDGVPFSKTLTIERSADMSAGKWLAVKGWYSKGEFVPNFWYMPQVVLRFLKGEEIVKTSFFRPNRTLYYMNEWKHLNVNIRQPKMDYDRIDLFLWRPQSTGSLYADEIEISVFEE